MKPLFRTLRTIALVTSLAAATAPVNTAHASANEEAIKLLTANFASRQVVKVEVGDFHFKAGQIAPVHTHKAPAIGYVTKGMIIYQVEGGKPQILRAGDAFFEPTEQRILRFDNASATEEAIFIDFNLEESGEPFIVFEENPTEAIDRRTLPTFKLNGNPVEKAEIFANNVEPSGSLNLKSEGPTLGLVTHGVIELKINGQTSKRIAAGETFILPTNGSQAKIVNASTEIPANVITLKLH